jgi:hypothetical protein
MDRPIAVMPLHDPGGLLFPHLKRAAPPLGQIFSEIIVRITTPTRSAQAEWLHWIERQGTFHIVTNGPGGLVGQQFCELYRAAAERYSPDQILHLCFPDRVAYALGSEYREQFIADIQATSAQNLPLLFQRSEYAWTTHPENYRIIENLATQVGQLVLGRSLDLTWCHMVLQTQQLQQVLPHLAQNDLSVLAEILMHFAGKVTKKDVDWLAWEDPFIDGRDAASLKQERESSLAETKKRLSYVIPTMGLIVDRGRT